MPSEDNTLLGPENKTTVRVLIAILCVTVTGVIGGAGFVYKVTDEIDDLKADHFGKALMSEWALRTAIANPGMEVPDPRDPNRLIVVHAAREKR
jgi:hypothetical protein